MSILLNNRKLIIGSVVGILLSLLAYFTLPEGSLYLNIGLTLVSVLWYSNIIREDRLSKLEKNIVLILIFVIPLIIFKMVNVDARTIQTFSIFMGIVSGGGILMTIFKK